MAHQSTGAINKLVAGQTVCVRQTIHTREGDWRTEVEGCVIEIATRPTGSWFAHGKDDKLWLRRLRLEKPDGEIVDMNLDRDSVVTILKQPA